MQMTKLVFGIIAVIGIHLAFIVCMHLQTPFELAIAPIESELVVPPYLYSAEVPTAAAFAVHQPEAQPSIIKTRYIAPKPRRERKAVKAEVLADVVIRAPKSPSSSPPTITTSGEFQSVVITYRRQTRDIRQLKMQDRSVTSNGLAVIN